MLDREIEGATAKQVEAAGDGACGTVKVGGITAGDVGSESDRRRK